MRWDDFLREMARCGIHDIPVHRVYDGHTFQLTIEGLYLLGFHDAAKTLIGTPDNYFCRTLNPFHDQHKKFGRAA